MSGLQIEGGSSPFKILQKGKTYSSKLISYLYLSKIHLQNKYRMLNNGIYIQSPLLQTALKALKNFLFHIVQRKGWDLVWGFFPGFSPEITQTLWKFMLSGLSNYIPNETAVLSVALKALLITKTYSESIYPLRVNHGKFLQFSN